MDVGYFNFDWKAVIALFSLFVSIMVFLYTIWKDNKAAKRAESQHETNVELSMKAEELTKKINSKEYQIYEDLKYSLLQVIASVRSIDAKAAVYLDNLRDPHRENKLNQDFSQEIEIISKLQSTPGYLIFLHSIEDSKSRTTIESIFRNLSMQIGYFDCSSIRAATHMLMNHIKSSINPALINNDEIYDLMIDLCTMDGVFTNFNYDNVLKYKELSDKFVKYLESKGIEKYEVSFSDDGIITDRKDELLEFFSKYNCQVAKDKTHY